MVSYRGIREGSSREWEWEPQMMRKDHSDDLKKKKTKMQ